MSAYLFLPFLVVPLLLSQVLRLHGIVLWWKLTFREKADALALFSSSSVASLGNPPLFLPSPPPPFFLGGGANPNLSLC